MYIDSVYSLLVCSELHLFEKWTGSWSELTPTQVLCGDCGLIYILYAILNLNFRTLLLLLSFCLVFVLFLYRLCLYNRNKCDHCSNLQVIIFIVAYVWVCDCVLNSIVVRHTIYSFMNLQQELTNPMQPLFCLKKNPIEVLMLVTGLS